MPLTNLKNSPNLFFSMLQLFLHSAHFHTQSELLLSAARSPVCSLMRGRLVMSCAFSRNLSKHFFFPNKLLLFFISSELLHNPMSNLHVSLCIGNTKTISVSIQKSNSTFHQWCCRILKINMCQTSNGTRHLIHQSTWFPKIYIFLQLPNHGYFNRRNLSIIKQFPTGLFPSMFQTLLKKTIQLLSAHHW